MEEPNHTVKLHLTAHMTYRLDEILRTKGNWDKHESLIFQVMAIYRKQIKADQEQPNAVDAMLTQRGKDEWANIPEESLTCTESDLRWLWEHVGSGEQGRNLSAPIGIPLRQQVIRGLLRLNPHLDDTGDRLLREALNARDSANNSSDKDRADNDSHGDTGALA